MRRRLTLTVCTLLAAASAVVVVRTADAAPVSRAATTATAAPRSVMYVGNNWAGTADIRRRPHVRQGRPDQRDPRPGAADGGDPGRPGAARLLPGDPAGDRRGPRPARRRHVQHARRHAAGGLPPELRRRRRDRPRAPAGSSGASRCTASAPTTWPSTRPAPGCSSRTPPRATSTSWTLRTGKPLRQFESGDTPHESNYSKDGSRIFHASIGKIYTPTDPSLTCPEPDPSKGDQRFEIVDNTTFAGAEAVGHRPEAAPRPASRAWPPRCVRWRSRRTSGRRTCSSRSSTATSTSTWSAARCSQVRPAAAERGRPEHAAGAVRPQLRAPRAGASATTARQLCVAGTMDDYVGLVDVRDPRDRKIFTLPHTGDRPYWATNGPGGSRCWVSIAGDDRVNVYDYATRTRLASLPVGDHPQRVRPGTISAAAEAALG